MFAEPKPKAPMPYQPLNMRAEGKSARLHCSGWTRSVQPVQEVNHQQPPLAERWRSQTYYDDHIWYPQASSIALEAPYCERNSLGRYTLACLRCHSRPPQPKQAFSSHVALRNLTCGPVCVPFSLSPTGQRNTTAECISSLASPSQRQN